MANSESGTIQTRSDYKDNPSDQYRYWNIELGSAGKRLTKWQTQADLIQRRYLDDRAGGGWVPYQAQTAQRSQEALQRHSSD
jgi:hypothetical protein